MRFDLTLNGMEVCRLRGGWALTMWIYLTIVFIGGLSRLVGDVIALYSKIGG